MISQREMMCSIRK